MIATITRVKSHLANWREWEINPIVIKELRQGVRSWTVTGMLHLFLIILFVVGITLLVTGTFEFNDGLGLGGVMFSWFTCILAGASMFFIPLYTGVRVAAERQENNPDLLYVTTLSPPRIIFGKFLCGAYIAVLFFSACMPFMAFTNILRGVDLPTVFFILAFLFMLVCAANMLAIFLACLPVSRPFKILFVLYGIAQSIVALAWMLAVCASLMQSGIGAMIGEPNFWVTPLVVTFLITAATGLFFVLSVALISPLSANRALPVRGYLTAAWCLGAFLDFWLIWQSKEADGILAWQIFTCFIMAFSLLNVISNADQLSQRVRRKIPRAFPARVLAFFLFNGAAGGLCWVGTIAVLTFLAGNGLRLIPGLRPAPGPVLDFVGPARIIALYAFAYALSALFIHRKFLPKQPPKMAGLIAILLVGGWALAPSFFLFLANKLSWKTIEGLQLGNIFNVVSNRNPFEMLHHLEFAAGWLALAVLLNLKWFCQQFKNFRPPETMMTPPVVQDKVP